MRCFIAVEPPPEVREQIVRHTQDRWSGCKGLRFMAAPQLHLTLRFLGDIDAAAAERAGDTLQETLGGPGPALCAIEGYGVFPKPRAPRVLWVGVTDCRSGQLGEWRRGAEAAALAAGCEPDRNDFVPHITVGRFRPDCVARVVGEHLERVQPVEADAFTIATVSLWQSVLQPTGPQYTKLREICL